MNIRALRHIAIIQTAFLGDVALALFLAQEIRTLHPDVELSMVCTPQAADLVRCAKAVDSVVVFDKRRGDRGWSGIRRRAHQLRHADVDGVIALQRSARTAVLARLSGARFSVGFREAAFSSLYSKRLPWELDQHEVQRNHSLLSAFDDCAQSTIPLKVDMELYDKARLASELDLPADELAQAVVVAPSSVWPTKRWPEDRMMALVKELRSQGRPVYLIGAKSDRELCARIADAAGARSLAGLSSMVQTVSLINAASVVVCNDSAPTHLAALCGTRCVVIYGSTLPEFGFAPRGSHDQIVETLNLACRPCGLHGRSQCPRQTMECMTSIRPSMVLDAIHRAEHDA